MKVPVLDTTRKPLAPTTPRRARLLLKRGKASVFQPRPFTIILKREVEDPSTPDLRLKIDPGSKTTGIAIVDQESGEVVFAAEIEHRGEAIKKRLDARRAVRRNRRGRKTRYRKPRFDNRRRPNGWLPPSLRSRVENVHTWTRRLTRAYPIKGIAIELARFDTQLMQNHEIEGVEYQQGELQGFEMREYVLIKFNHRCVYAGAKSPCDEVLNVDHLVPRSRGGSNRLSNLVCACRKHNEEKSNLSLGEFSPIKARAKEPLKDAAAVNSTRWALLNRLKCSGMLVETGSGGLTKFNRTRRGLPKEHWIDAACVGRSTPEKLNTANIRPLRIKAVGHNSRQVCRMDKYGFPRTSAKASRTVKGFRTGDLVRAIVLDGKKQGIYVGKVAVRSSGSFNVVTGQGTIQGISYRHCRTLRQADGYSTAG